MNPISRIVRFRANAGQGDVLAHALLGAAEAVAEAPGCLSWSVLRDAADPDAILVVESWLSSEHADAALAADDADAVGNVMALLAERPQRTDAVPLGGAREVLGTTGATAFSIFEAPDLSQDEQLTSRYELSEVGEARYVRRELGAAQVGLTHYRLPPGRRLGWAHRHAAAEEIYVVISGSARMKVDDDLFDLARLEAVRVAPSSVREFEAGPDGAEVLAAGAHVPGDGELVPEWWPS